MESSAGMATPSRIVCASPALAEIVFALGCGDRVVGVSDYTEYPPEAARKDRIGGWINPNRERLLLLRPDIILFQGRHASLSAFAEEYGIRFHGVDLDTYEDLHLAIGSIAEVLSAVERGSDLQNLIRDAVGRVRRRSAGVPPRRVLLVLGRSPGSLTGLSTAGPGTFLDDMIRAAGGTNVFADAKGVYPSVSKESILVREPEVILEVNPGGWHADTIARLRSDWREFPDVPAVRNGRIAYLDDAYLLIPGPRIGQTAERLARAIYPELLVE